MALSLGYLFIRKKGGQVTKSIILVKLWYVIKGVKYIDKVCNFMASADIKVFGHTCLFAMLLLIGFALFYTPGVLV